MKVHFPEVERKAIVHLSQEALWTEDSEDVRETLNYLRVERGLTDDVIKKFRFGYYPQRLKKQGHDWAGRLIMPLYDQHDELIILTSRDFRCKDKTKMPHLHEQFDKKFFLFGMNVAKADIIKYQKAIVVEGQFDTACSHRYGFGVTVGLLGSAFSPYHLCIISRYCRDIFLSFDSDDSGFKNLNRSVKMYREYGLESTGIRFIPVVLPKHKDPDEFLKKESSVDYLELLREAKAKVEELGLKKYCLSLSNKYSQIEID